MSGKRNVSVCRGHELANALYTLTERIIHKALLEELSKRKQAGQKNLTIRRKKIVRLDHKWVWDSSIEISGKISM